MNMYMNGMGDASNPAMTDVSDSMLALPMTTVQPLSPDQLAITNEYPVVSASAPTFAQSLNTPVIAGFTMKQVLIGAVALGVLYLLLKRK